MPKSQTDVSFEIKDGDYRNLGPNYTGVSALMIQPFSTPDMRLDKVADYLLQGYIRPAEIVSFSFVPSPEPTCRHLLPTILETLTALQSFAYVVLRTDRLSSLEGGRDEEHWILPRSATDALAKSAGKCLKTLALHNVASLENSSSLRSFTRLEAVELVSCDSPVCSSLAFVPFLRKLEVSRPPEKCDWLAERQWQKLEDLVGFLLLRLFLCRPNTCVLFFPSLPFGTTIAYMEQLVAKLRRRLAFPRPTCVATQVRSPIHATHLHVRTTQSW
jgi:hypothetical protein